MSVHSAGHSMVATLARWSWKGWQGPCVRVRGHTSLGCSTIQSVKRGETKIDQMQRFEIRQKYIGEGWWLETRLYNPRGQEEIASKPREDLLTMFSHLRQPALARVS